MKADVCTGRKPFASWRQAARRAAWLRRDGRVQNVAPYRCRHCHAWHLGTRTPPSKLAARPPERPERFDDMADILDPVPLSDQEKRSWYEAEIQPALKALADRCHARGLDFLAVVDVAPSGLGITGGHASMVNKPFALCIAAALCGGDEDRLIEELILYAATCGHRSAYLTRLGVPTEPQPEGQRAPRAALT